MNSYVNDFNETVQLYYRELSKYKSKTKEEEQELFQKYGKTDKHVKDEIIKSNLKYVFEIAKRYKGQGVPLEDLISEGNIGLLKAYDKFDPTKNIKFFSYAVWWIRSAIQESIKTRREIDSIEDKEEDSLKSSVKENKVHDCEDETVVLEDVTMSNYEDMIAKEDDDERKFFVNELLSKVDRRSRQVIEMYYGINNKKNYTLDEIGDKLDLTKERIRQISKKNIRFFKSKVLEEKYASVCI